MIDKPRTLGAILYNDFELLDLYGPLEMFGNLGDACRIVTVADCAGLVASTQGPRTEAEYGYGDCPPLDLILLPGGWGTVVELENQALLDFLRERSRSAEYTMSVCSGSAILARAGVLDGRRATSNKQLFQLATMQSDKVQWVEEARWVVDGPFVTASGVSGVSDTSKDRLSFLGLKIADDGTLSIDDTSKLDAAINEGSLAELFNTSSTGLGVQFDNLIEGFVVTGGIISDHKSIIDSRLKTLDRQILTLGERIDKKAQTFRQQFASIQESILLLQGQASAFQAFNSRFG